MTNGRAAKLTLWFLSRLASGATLGATFGAALAVAFGLAPTIALSAAPAAADPIPPLRPLVAGDSILVVSPHPDDESLCCGGLVNTARRLGASVAIVWVTNGDGFKWDAMVVERKLRPRAGAYLELARQRESEARAAGASLGVPAESFFFLGYPDRGVLRLLFDYYHPNTPWRSKFTGANAVVYENAVDPGAEYDGEDLVRDFNSVLDRVKPTLVLAPSPQDTHPDHRGAGLLAWRTLTARKQQDLLRFWIVHGGHGWPHPHGLHAEQPQTVAPRGLGMSWEQFTLDAAAIDAKTKAIAAHKSQTKVMGRVMQSYVRSNELYSRSPAPPRSACTHAEPCEFGDESLMEKSGL
jgi:LmbE family N-acetylglucosaminyl deacetylase